MPDRAEIVVSIDPSTRAAVVRVTGPLPEGSSDVLRRVVRRAAGIAGPHVRVDLAACTLLDPAVARDLAEERALLSAQGGALVCEGPAGRAAGCDGPSPAPAPAVDPSVAARLRARLSASGMSTRQLWLEHLHLGADLELDQVRDALTGARGLEDHAHAVLDHALHEALARVPVDPPPRVATPS